VTVPVDRDVSEGPGASRARPLPYILASSETTHRRRDLALDDWNLTHSSAPSDEGGLRPRKTERLLDAVNRALHAHVRDAQPSEIFGDLLGELIALTNSEYAYIGEVLHDERGDPYLLTWAISNIAWNETTRAMYEEQAVQGDGLEFRNLDTLFGWGLAEGGRLVLSNETAGDLRCSGRPEGHPPLNSFMGIPVFCGDELVGQMGVANRPGGYDETLATELEPFTFAVGHLIDGYRSHRGRERAEAMSQRLVRRQASMLSHINDLVTLVDGDGNWIESNPARTRLLGYPTDFDPPGGVLALLHPDDRDAGLEAFTAIVEGRRGPDELIELRVRASDGTYRVLAFAGNDLRADPAIGGVVITGHDTTAYRRAELAARERTAQLSALLSTLHLPVLFMDQDRRIVLMNQAWCDLFGYEERPDEMIGWRSPTDQWLLDSESGAAPHEPLPPTLALVADPITYAEDLRAAYAGGVPVLERPVNLRDGRVLERDYLPIGDEQGAIGHLWIYRDVTARAELEAERERLLSIEREQRQLVEAQVASLMELDLLKTHFVAAVSHELRTPLTSIISFAELLTESGENLRTDQREFLEIVSRNADRLSVLVDDLLLFAHLESGGLRVDPRPTEFESAIRAATEGFFAECTRKGLQLIVDLSGSASPARLDPQRFDQIIQNLVSNAVKFTPAGGRITVSARHEPDHLLLSVSDTGIGIPEDQQPRLFDPFFRSNNALMAGVPGTGLGLAIVSRLVDLHGGTIDIQSSSSGTTVIVRFPDAGSAVIAEA
jgi:PAS domain S-box-containing protein